MKFTDGLDNDLKNALLSQLKSLWTHTSTAIEGNTLDLGETDFVIREGLTIKGKPVKDHEEVIGHARAIDLLFDLTRRNTLMQKEDLFALHKTVMTQVVIDIYQPIGAWKVEDNYTYGVDSKDQQFLIEFSDPVDVPQLMLTWLDLLNEFCTDLSDNVDVLVVRYTQLHLAFVRIHPFFDGNGRLARLLSNLPLLKSGFPPIVIPAEQRQDYLKHLSTYHARHGQTKLSSKLSASSSEFIALVAFFNSAWSGSIELVKKTHALQEKRRKKDLSS